MAKKKIEIVVEDILIEEPKVITVKSYLRATYKNTTLQLVHTNLQEVVDNYSLEDEQVAIEYLDKFDEQLSRGIKRSSEDINLFFEYCVCLSYLNNSNVTLIY